MGAEASRVFRVGDTAEFHPHTNVLHVDDRVVRLRPQTGAVLRHMLMHPDRVISKDELLHAVWPGVVVTENSLVQCVTEIRRELGANRSAIETVPRRGYWFHPPLADTVGEDIGATTTAREEPVGTSPVALARREKGGYWRGVAAVFGVLLVLGGAYWWHSLVESSAVPASRLEQTPRLSMAVLPFALNAADAGQRIFAEQVADALTRDLAQIPGVKVVARSATTGYLPGAANPRRAGRELNVNYIVEGSVERVAGQFAVDLRLIDAATGAQQWSDRVDMSTAMASVDPRDVAGRLAQLLKADLVESEIARLDLKSPRSFDANDLALRAWVLWQRDSAEDNAQAQALARQAIALDPESLLAWRVLAGSMMLDRVAAWTDDPEGALERAEAAVRRALTINPRQPQINTILGAIMAVRGRYVEALAALEAELTLGSRQDPQLHEWLGVTYLLMGNPGRALKPLETAIWLSPRDARLSYLWRTLAIAQMHTGDLCQGRESAWSAVRTPRPSLRAYETLAAVCTMYGDDDCAKGALAELLRIAPSYSITQVTKEVSSSEPAFVARRQQYLAALRMAGLPQ